MLNSIPDIDPLIASSILPLVWQVKMTPGIATCSPKVGEWGEQDISQLTTIDLEGML